MKEHIGQDKIRILTEYSQKVAWEKDLRILWRNCFGDPLYYEDFYFDKVYSNNKVYAIEGKGMIHVNFYRCKVRGKEMSLPYIVGVATDERYRRQGVMRRLLERVLFDLEKDGIPFAYLMPAKEEYYTSFGFRSVTKKSEYEITTIGVKQSMQFRYLSYREFLNLPKDFREQIYEMVNRWLEKRYDIYTVHDEEYYDLLYAEKMCQSGDVVFCFEDVVDIKRLCAVLAYAMDENVSYVEQIIMQDDIQQLPEKRNALFRSYFATCDRIRIAVSYPYMLRMVHREAFLELFAERLSGALSKPVEELTDEQILIELFEEKDNIYFAEIV